MQIRWRNIWTLSFWTTVVVSAVLAVSIVISTQPKRDKVSVASVATERTLYKEIRPVGFADPYIPPHIKPKSLEKELSELHLPPKEEAAARDAAQQAAEDADAAVKR